MTQTYPLTITRNRGVYGKVRALQIYADTPRGPWRVGEVKQGESVTVEVPQDATQIYGKMDWCKSKPMDLAFVNAGETIYANAWFTLNPLRNMGLMQVPMAMESTPR